MSQTNEIKGVFYSISFRKCKQVYLEKCKEVSEKRYRSNLVNKTLWFYGKRVKFCFLLRVELSKIILFLVYLLFRNISNLYVPTKFAGIEYPIISLQFFAFIKHLLDVTHYLPSSSTGVFDRERHTKFIPFPGFYPFSVSLDYVFPSWHCKGLYDCYSVS